MLHQRPAQALTEKTSLTMQIYLANWKYFLDWNKDNCYSMCLQYFKPRTCVQINLLEAFPPVYSILSQERNVRWIKLIWRMLIQSSGRACPAVSRNKSQVHNWPSLSLYQSLYHMMYPDCNIVSAGDVVSMDDLTLSGDIISDDWLPCRTKHNTCHQLTFYSLQPIRSPPPTLDYILNIYTGNQSNLLLK